MKELLKILELGEEYGSIDVAHESGKVNPVAMYWSRGRYNTIRAHERKVDHIMEREWSSFDRYHAVFIEGPPSNQPDAVVGYAHAYVFDDLEAVVIAYQWDVIRLDRLVGEYETGMRQLCRLLWSRAHGSFAVDVRAFGNCYAIAVPMLVSLGFEKRGRHWWLATRHNIGEALAREESR